MRMSDSITPREWMESTATLAVSSWGIWLFAFDHDPSATASLRWGALAGALLTLLLAGVTVRSLLQRGRAGPIIGAFLVGGVVFTPAVFGMMFMVAMAGFFLVGMTGVSESQGGFVIGLVLLGLFLAAGVVVMTALLSLAFGVVLGRIGPFRPFGVLALARIQLLTLSAVVHAMVIANAFFDARLVL